MTLFPDMNQRHNSSVKRIIDGLWRLGLRVAYRLLRAVWFVSRPRISVHGREVVSGEFMSLNNALTQKLLPPGRAYLARISHSAS